MMKVLKRAITKLQAVAIMVVIVIVAILGGVIYYYYIMPPSPPSKPSPGGLLTGATLRVGIAVPLSGAYAYDGESGLYGIQLAVNEINQAGGILGAKIKLYVEDYASDPKIATTVVEKLITVDNIHVLRICYASSAAFAAHPIAEKYHVPDLAVGCSAATLLQQGWKYFFKPAPRSDDFASKIVDFLKEVVEPQLKPLLGRSLKIAVMHDKGIIGISDKDAVLQFIAQKAPDFQVVAVESYDLGCLDFKPVLEKIKALNPDIFIFSSILTDAVLHVKQSAELGFKPYIYIGCGGAGPQHPKFIELAGEATKYVFTAHEFWIDRQWPDPKALREFATTFYETYSRPLDYQSYMGYAGIYMLKQVIEAAAEKDPESVKNAFLNDDVKTIREMIRDGIATMKFNIPWFGEVQFDELGQMTTHICISEILPATSEDLWSANGLTFRTVWPPPYNSTTPLFPWKTK